MTTRISIVAFPIVLSVMGVLMWAPTPAASQDSATALTFHKDVLPVLQKNCQSCHRPGQIGPFSMLTFKETRPWAKAIKLAVASRTMPPWFANPRYGHFNNDRSLKQAEIDTVVSCWRVRGSLAFERVDLLDSPRSRTQFDDNRNMRGLPS